MIKSSVFLWITLFQKTLPKTAKGSDAFEKHRNIIIEVISFHAQTSIMLSLTFPRVYFFHRHRIPLLSSTKIFGIKSPTRIPKFLLFERSQRHLTANNENLGFAHLWRGFPIQISSLLNIPLDLIDFAKILIFVSGSQTLLIKEIIRFFEFHGFHISVGHPYLHA